MWRCRPAFAWGCPQWDTHPPTAYSQSRRHPAWHGKMSFVIGGPTTGGSWLVWGLALMMNPCCSRASRMLRKASAACRWMQRNCTVCLVQSLIDWFPDVWSHNPRGSKGDWRCLCRLAVWAFQWRQQTYPLLSPSSSSTPTICLRIWSTPHLGHRRMGVWWRRLAGRLQILPHEPRRSFVLHRGLFPPRMAEASLYDLHWFAFWSPLGSHVLQSLQQVGGSFVTSIHILLDQFVFWWCSCDGQEVLQRIRSTSDAVSQHPSRHTLLSREVPEDATIRYFLGTWSWLQSNSHRRYHPVLGTWTHRTEAPPSHEACWGFQQASTRSCCQDLWHRQLLRIGSMGAHWLRRFSPNQAPTTGTHLRVDWGAASMLRLVAHCHCYQTLQDDRDLATCRATFSGSLRCSLGNSRPRDRRIFGSLADGCIQQREAFVSIIPPVVYHLWLWEPGDTKIAQLELLQVLYALFTRPSTFRGRRGLWFIDNTAALMALIRGRSDNADLEHMSRLIHVTLFALKAWFFWEWIPSKANWSDEISREGLQATWHKSHGFTTHFAVFPFEVWSLPLPAFLQVVEFL